MAIRNPNGYGSIKKLSGKRRRPYAVVVTTKYDAKAKDISFLKEALGDELFAEVKEKYEKHIDEKVQGGQVQKCIGYYETRPEAMIALLITTRIRSILIRGILPLDRSTIFCMKKSFRR